MYGVLCLNLCMLVNKFIRGFFRLDKFQAVFWSKRFDQCNWVIYSTNLETRVAKRLTISRGSHKIFAYGVTKYTMILAKGGQIWDIYMHYNDCTEHYGSWKQHCHSCLWLCINVHGFILVHVYFSVLTLLRKLVWALQEAKICLMWCYICSSTFPDSHVCYSLVAESK